MYNLVNKDSTCIIITQVKKQNIASVSPSPPPETPIPMLESKPSPSYG